MPPPPPTSSSSSSFNFPSLTGKRKPKKSVDDSALVKAAAWAWYEHGSGSEGRLVREFDLSRPQVQPKPSRYKLEAMKQAQKPIHHHSFSLNTSSINSPCFIEPSANTNPSSTTSHYAKYSLLDKYEVERISRQLYHYIESSHAKYNHHAELGESDLMMKDWKKGFWPRHAAMAVCGSSRYDVVVVDGRQRGLRGSTRWPEVKHVPVVKFVNCRPRIIHDS